MWDFAIWLRFDSMNKIRKLDRILNEENRNVVPHNVCVLVSTLLCRIRVVRLTEVTLICVETDSKAVYITYGIG